MKATKGQGRHRTREARRRRRLQHLKTKYAQRKGIERAIAMLRPAPGGEP